MSVREAMAAKYSEYAAASPQERKRRRIIETAEKPVIPKLSLIWFLCMLVATSGMVASDVMTWVRYNTDHDMTVLIGNAGMTGLISFVFFSMILIPICLIQMHRDSMLHIKPAGNSFKENYSFFMPYSIYITVCLGGMAAAALMCLLT